jgi:hypothetical protein
MNRGSPRPFNVRRLIVAALGFVVFLVSLKVGSLYADYAGSIAFSCILVQLLLVLSYFNRQA